MGYRYTTPTAKTPQNAKYSERKGETMPKTKFDRKPKHAPYDPLRELLTRYQKDRGYTVTAMAMKCGYCNGGYYSEKRKNGVQKFRIEEFCFIANVLDIPPDEVGAAIAAYYKEYRT